MRRWSVSLRSVTQMIVRGSHAETSSDTYRPTPAHLAHWRGRDRVSRHNSTPGPTGVKCAGESRGHGRDSRRGAWSRQISHIISLGHFSRPPENVAIPTIQLQYLNKSLGNYVRNCSDGGKTPAKQISHAIRLEQISTNPENVAIPTISFQGLKELWGNCMRNWGAQQRCARGPRQGPRAVSGPAAVPVGGGGAWPGFETTRRAKLAARTARGRAAAHRHTQRPVPPAPGTPAAPQATQQPGYAKGAGTEVPAPCRLTQPLPRRGLGRMTVSPGDGDASTGTCRQRRQLPGPLRRSGRRSRCGRGPSSAWWPGRRARRNRSSRR